MTVGTVRGVKVDEPHVVCTLYWHLCKQTYTYMYWQ